MKFGSNELAVLKGEGVNIGEGEKEMQREYLSLEMNTYHIVMEIRPSD